MRKRTKTPQQFQRGYAPVSFSITASIVAASIAIAIAVQLLKNVMITLNQLL